MAQHRSARNPGRRRRYRTTRTFVTNGGGNGSFGWVMLALFALFAFAGSIVFSQVGDAEIATDAAMAASADDALHPARIASRNASKRADEAVNN